MTSWFEQNFSEYNKKIKITNKVSQNIFNSNYYISFSIKSKTMEHNCTILLLHTYDCLIISSGILCVIFRNNSKIAK